MDIFEDHPRRHHPRVRLPEGERQDPVVTYSRIEPDQDGGRMEPRLTTPGAKRYREETAAPVDAPRPRVSPLVDEDEEAVPLPRRGKTRRRSGSGVRLAVVVGFLALVAAFGLLALTYGGAVKTAVVNDTGSDRLTEPGAVAAPDANVSAVSVTTSPDTQTTTVTRVAPDAATARPTVVPPIPTLRPTPDTATAATPPSGGSAPVTVAPPPGAATTPDQTASAPPAADNSIDSLMQSVDRIIAEEKVRASSAPAADTPPIDTTSVDTTATGGDGAAIDLNGADTTLLPDNENGPAMDGDTGADPLVLAAPPAQSVGGQPIVVPPSSAPDTAPPPLPGSLFNGSSNPVPPADIPNTGNDTSTYSSW